MKTTLTPRGDIRNIHSGITLADDVDLVSLHIKSVDKVGPELHELGGHVLLVLGGGSALRKPRADGLVNVDDVGQAVPTPWILNGGEGSVLPQERAILLKQALERRASGLDTDFRSESPSGGQGGIQKNVHLRSARSVSRCQRRCWSMGRTRRTAHPSNC